MTRTELRPHSERIGSYQSILERGLFKIFSFVDDAGYEASFCNGAGVTILNLPLLGSCSTSALERPGSLWLEELEGTNGIGTCLWEKRPISVYQTEHFLSRYAQNSCSAAPIISSSGVLLGIYNITTSLPGISAQTHRMAFSSLLRMADEVERNIFRFDHRACHLLELLIAPNRLALIAMNEEGIVVAVNRHARALLGTGHAAIEGRPIWSFVERSFDFVRHDHHMTATVVLLESGARMSGRIFRPSARPQPASASARRGEAARPSACALHKATGEDLRMQQNVALLERVRDTVLPVLLLGETGTGKDVLARAIHQSSARARKPFVALNCAALPESLIDSELFGYGAGAFTGAKRDGQAGRIVEAHGGTLFLDEIGDMPLALQTRLLRFLENGEVMPIGGGRVREVDVRVIAATNVSALQAVKEGRFRADLYYRLAGVVINVPRLRERTDFELIARNVLADIARDISVPISAAAMALLKAHAWPGNIRELRNVLQRAYCFSGHDGITAEHLLFDGDLAAPQFMVPPAPAPAAEPCDVPPVAVAAASSLAPPAR